MYLPDFSKDDSRKLSVLEHAQEFVATAASFKLASFYERFGSVGRKTDFPPGAGWEYSNTGFILAQMIIEKASRSRSYERELDRLITALKRNMQGGCEQVPTTSDDSRRECRVLRNTFYEPYFYPDKIADRLVSGYYANTDPPTLDKLLGDDTSRFSLGWAQAAGGMLSTPQDLVMWV